MRTRILDLDHLTPADFDAWQRLADRAVSPNAFLDPRFLRTARAAFPEAGSLHLLVADDGGEWQGVLAFTTKRVHPRLRWRTTTTGGDFMTSHADRHHPLLDRDRPSAALRALLTGLRDARLPRLLQLQHVPADGPVADALEAVCAGNRMPLVERRRSWAPVADRHTVLSRSSAIEDGPLPLLLGHLIPDDARNTRRRLRGLARELGAPVIAEQRGDDPGLDEEFIALQHAGWKGRAESGGASLHLHPAREQWFRDVTAGFRARGDLIGLRLTAAGRTLWIGYLIRSGGSYFGFLDAYAEEFHRFSPGTLGRLAAFTHVFTATDAPLFDPGFDARYTVGARLFPDRRTQVDVLVATGGLLPRAVVLGWPHAIRAVALLERVQARVRAVVARADQTVRGSAGDETTSAGMPEPSMRAVATSVTPAPSTAARTTVTATDAAVPRNSSTTAEVVAAVVVAPGAASQPAAAPTDVAANSDAPTESGAVPAA